MDPWHSFCVRAVHSSTYAQQKFLQVDPCAAVAVYEWYLSLAYTIRDKLCSVPEWKCTAVYHGVSRGNRMNYRENRAHSTWYYASNRALTARNRPATARNLGGIPVLPLSRRKWDLHPVRARPGFAQAGMYV